MIQRMIRKMIRRKLRKFKRKTKLILVKILILVKKKIIMGKDFFIVVFKKEYIKLIVILCIFGYYYTSIEVISFLVEELKIYKTSFTLVGATVNCNNTLQKCDLLIMYSPKNVTGETILLNIEKWVRKTDIIDGDLVRLVYKPALKKQDYEWLDTELSNYYYIDANNNKIEFKVFLSYSYEQKKYFIRYKMLPVLNTISTFKLNMDKVWTYPGYYSQIGNNLSGLDKVIEIYNERYLKELCYIYTNKVKHLSFFIEVSTKEKTSIAGIDIPNIMKMKNEMPKNIGDAQVIEAKSDKKAIMSLDAMRSKREMQKATRNAREHITRLGK